MFTPLRRGCTLSVCVAILWFVSSANAQTFTSDIGSDGSLGTDVGAPVAIPGGMQYDISGGTIAGKNQFHSFDRFSVGTGDVASFNGPTNIKNVISRVTGGSASGIDGTIASTISGANVFLLNPAGVMLGPNAQIAVDGAFHTATANYLSLDDGNHFYVDPAEASTLTTADPAAFGFAEANPAGISVQGNRVNVLPSVMPPIGTDISLIGGEISVSGANLYAPLGRINLAAVVSPGEALLTNAAIDLNGFAELGPVGIGGGSFIDSNALYIQGGQITIGGAFLAPGVGTLLRGLPAPGSHLNNGLIEILARGELTVNSGATGTVIGSTLAEALPVGTGPTVRLEAGETLSIEGIPSVPFSTIIATERWQPGAAGELVLRGTHIEIVATGDIYAINRAPGPGPDITVDAQTVALDGSVLNAWNFGPGSAGSIRIGSMTNPADAVLLRGDSFPARIIASTFGAGSGPAGDIDIWTGTLTLLGDTEIGANSLGDGAGGNVTIDATDAIRMTGRDVNAESVIAAVAAEDAFDGKAGTITIDAPLLAMEAASITTRTERASDAGNVDITVGTLSATDATITSETRGDGDAGEVVVSAGNIRLTEGAQIRSFSGGVNNVSGALVVGSGSAGAVTVTATESLDISGTSTTNNRPSALSTQTRGDGPGGTLTVNARSLTVGAGGLVAADTGGDGDGGTVRVDAGNVLVNGGEISSGSGLSVAITNGQVDLLGDGNGGDVTVIADNGVTVRNGGRIVASSRGPGLAGNVLVDGGNQVEVIGGSIDTESLVSDGGDIGVQATDLVYLNGGKITTSVVGAGGTGGNIDIDPTFVVLQGPSQVIANATNPAAVQAGNITITGDYILISQSSLVQASGPTNAQDGEIIIRGPDGDLSRALAQLPESYLQAAGLLKGGCGIGRAGVSTLVLSGRGGVPVSPDGYVPSFDLVGNATQDDHGAARLTVADELVAFGPSDPTRAGWLLADLGCP